MIKWVVSAALRFSRLVVAAAIGILGVGVYQLHNAAVDVYPEFEPPDIQIQAEALGLSAQEVEQLITVPIEQDLLNGIPWVEHIRSQSMPGLSAIDLQFEPGTDLLCGSAADAGTDVASQSAAQCGHSADHDPAQIFYQSCRDGRDALGQRFGNADVGSGALADPATANEYSWRRQRVDLGNARSPAASPGRSAALAIPEGHSHPAHRDDGQCIMGFPAELCGGFHTRYGRIR